MFIGTYAVLSNGKRTNRILVCADVRTCNPPFEYRPQTDWLWIWTCILYLSAQRHLFCRVERAGYRHDCKCTSRVVGILPYSPPRRNNHTCLPLRQWQHRSVWGYRPWYCGTRTPNRNPGGTRTFPRRGPCSYCRCHQVGKGWQLHFALRPRR